MPPFDVVPQGVIDECPHVWLAPRDRASRKHATEHSSLTAVVRRISGGEDAWKVGADLAVEYAPQRRSAVGPDRQELVAVARVGRRVCDDLLDEGEARHEEGVGTFEVVHRILLSKMR